LRKNSHNNETSIRAQLQSGRKCFPLSNWTEIDVWSYIERENIPVVPLYFAKSREVAVRQPAHSSGAGKRLLPGEKTEQIVCRMRSYSSKYSALRT
jgi:3'-phosphoadenosine 5'-phosphosulfate sulfotransferase (PAPS reductase)/FAD synthetase